MAYSKKPDGCLNCVLYTKGLGFAPPIGPPDAPILVIGEALGRKEAELSKPFVGPSGMYLEKALRLVGLAKSDLRIANVVSCRPPDDHLSGAPWEADAIANCHKYLAPVLAENHKVVLAMGATATRVLLGVPKDHKNPFRLNNWHGTVNILEGYGSPKVVVPTYHPAYMLRGNQKLTSAVLFALQLAKKGSVQPLKNEGAELIIDPLPHVFAEWASRYDPAVHWLAVDIETNGKLLKSEEEVENVAEQILRINFSYHPGQGLTVPFSGQYLDTIRTLLSSPGVKAFWNAPFDVPRLRDAGCPTHGTILDFMDAWHVLQSDLPRGLGFVAPFYSAYGPWKHLSAEDPATYAAIDAVQTIRCAFGISRDLERHGRWDTFVRHVYDLNTEVLQPATRIGVLVDQVRLEAFRGELYGKKAMIAMKLMAAFPPELVPVLGPWKKLPANKPLAYEAFYDDDYLECLSCDARDITKKHRCKDKSKVPNVVESYGALPGWFEKGVFNPGSNDQIGAYIKHKGYDTGQTASGKIATDKLALESLAKKDPFFKDLLDYRAIDKVESTYVEATIERLKAVSDGRLHAQFLNKPSTMRLSCIEPNLTNVVQDKDAKKPAAGFRKCIVAAPGCWLVEADAAAIEAVETGWFAGDVDYIRLAKLGVHAYLTSHLVGQPADLKWSDSDLGAYFKVIKTNFDPEYNKAKKVVHGTNYGLTPFGMAKRFPDLFNSSTATKIQNLYLDLCPKLKAWQESVRARAHRQHYLGGNDHPFKYQHWFWDVYAWAGRKKNMFGEWVDTWNHGGDYNRVVAFYPQSTAAGVLKEEALSLANAVAFAGPNHDTAFRALIHDSILLEVRDDLLDVVLENLHKVMTAEIKSQPCPPEWGIGPFLKIGVNIKVGRDWMSMQDEAPQVGVAGDLSIEEEEEA